MAYSPRVKKYFLAVKAGKSKRKAQELAGYSTTGSHGTQIERTDEYQKLERTFRDELQARTTKGELIDELMKVARQDGELGAKNKALEIAMSRLEPIESSEPDTGVMVILGTSERVEQIQPAADGAMLE